MRVSFGLVRTGCAIDAESARGVWFEFAGAVMELDEKKIDEAVLALLLLGVHEECRAWKGFDWDAMNRLHEKGYISDPRSKAKSVVFTEEGMERAKELLEKLFGK
jgi:hypothetical protein